MRYAAAIAIVAVTFAGAVYVHQRHGPPGYQTITGGRGVIFVPHPHPSWEDPVAILLALGGLAAAVGIAVGPRRNSPAPARVGRDGAF